MKKLPLILSLSLVASLSVFTAFASQAPDAKQTAPLKIPGFEAAPKNARVFFVNLKNKQTISEKFTVKFGVENMKIHPAGELIEGTGHHHLIIDGSAIPEGQVVPTDAQHLHFGKGQTETEVTLAPGKHKLTLQFANGAHLSYGPAMSATVDVVAK